MACCGVRVIGRRGDLLWFVFATALLLANFPSVPCAVSGQTHPGNRDKVRPDGTRDPEINEVMIDPLRYEASSVGHGLGAISPRKVTGDTEGNRVSGGEPSKGKQTSRDRMPILVGRKRRENPKLRSPDEPMGAHLPQRPWLGNDCTRVQPPSNPTVVAGIIGGALAFFLVVVLTIVYCSYRNHPPSDTRKRLAEMYAYMRGLEEVWVGVANTGTNVDTESAKYQEWQKMNKGYMVV
ncbi:uncharacterized protein LOC119732617 [Patiria miniata]|uniref:Uncharacterized protein n=1 Tax=Patiria miniata TaxID=46514 RepID=A0A914AEF7_PATMI|nr:uncharacterized protein LOC119732617 [Patiria miniata]